MRQADIVVSGVVVRVDDAKWNSPDGKEWKGNGLEGADEVIPLVYTTFYGQPDKTVKGKSVYGEPVPFRFMGGYIGDMSQVTSFDDGIPNVKVGDHVLVLGSNQPGFKGTFTPSYYTLA